MNLEIHPTIVMKAFTNNEQVQLSTEIRMDNLESPHDLIDVLLSMAASCVEAAVQQGKLSGVSSNEIAETFKEYLNECGDSGLRHRTR